MSPLGVLSEAFSLEEVCAQIEQGHNFPSQGISRYGGEPVAASALPELRTTWDKVLPPMTPFDGAAGRAKPIILARFFAELSLSRATGYLTLRQNDAQLYFAIRIVDGQLLEVLAHDPSTYLGQILVQQGLITSHDLSHILKVTLERAQPLGKVCIDEGLITHKDLNRTLAEQLFIRLRRIACFPKFDIRFRPDRRARMTAPVARVSGYAALEITLGYGLSDLEIKEYLSALRARPTLIDAKATGISLLSGEDRNVLKRIHASQDLSPLTDRPHWTQRDGALKAIAWDMLHIFQIPRIYALLEELSHLQGEEGLKHLGLDEQSSQEEKNQFATTYFESLQLSSPSESEEEEQVKIAIRTRVASMIAGPQYSPRERNAIERMKQTGDALDDEDLKISLMFDEAMNDGEIALKRSKFAEAHQAFHEAVSYRPQNQNAQLQLLWSSFLSSNRGEGAYLSVKAQAEHLIKRNPNATEAIFKLAQIHRIYGNMEAAEHNLRAILKVDPNHAGAQGELRLLINREFDQKKRKKSFFTSTGEVGLNRNLSRGVIALLLTLSAIILGAGILTPLDQTRWPDLKVLSLDTTGQNQTDQERNFYQSLRVNYEDEFILTTAYRLGLKLHPKVRKTNDRDAYDFSEFQLGRSAEFSRAIDYLFKQYADQPVKVLQSLRESKTIPTHMRVLGILESYWLSTDPFWWARRILLLLVGTIGVIIIKPWEIDTSKRNRQAPSDQTSWHFEKKPAFTWTLLAGVYGFIVGYLSPTLGSPTPFGLLCAMIAFHTLVEQLVFTGLLGGILFKHTRGLPISSLLAAIGVFTLYRLSYAYFWYLPSEQMTLNLLQIGIFVGGATTFLAWKTRSFLPPFVAHFALTITPAILAN